MTRCQPRDRCTLHHAQQDAEGRPAGAHSRRELQPGTRVWGPAAWPQIVNLSSKRGLDRGSTCS